MNLTRNVFFLLYKCSKSYGYYPELRVLLFNNYGCYYRRKNNTQKALSYIYNALKIISNNNVRKYVGTTYMNFSTILSSMGEYIIY